MTSAQQGGLSTGAKAGIGIASCAMLLLTLFGIYFLLLLPKRRDEEVDADPTFPRREPNSEKAEPGTTIPDTTVKSVLSAKTKPHGGEYGPGYIEQ
jgi:hypothetical protein